MPLQQNEILFSTRNLLKQVPYRTTFERENFLFNSQGGPRLLVTLCQDIEFLNSEYLKVSNDWEKEAILAEMNAVNAKIVELKEHLSKSIKTIQDPATKIKVGEIAKQLVELDKTSKVNDDHLVDLMQYYELVQEIKKANGVQI
jgi:hypothetical protein